MRKMKGVKKKRSKRRNGVGRTKEAGSKGARSKRVKKVKRN